MEPAPPIDHHSGTLTAWKVAGGCNLIDNTVTFDPLALAEAGPTPALGAHATCHAGPGRSHREPVPAWGCTCGFWGCADLRAVRAAIRRPLRFYDIFLEVELSGRVIEHDRGWRAAYQRVNQAVFQRRCGTCGSRRHVDLMISDRGRIAPMCRRHATTATMFGFNQMDVTAGWGRAPLAQLLPGMPQWREPTEPGG